ncbi:MAG: GtrA family protein [Leptospiraceae bacterium]|nr:GtrA family protein [Leptospiraceae bacterium]
MKLIKHLIHKFKNQFLEKLIKFLFVGGFSTIVNYLSFFVLFEYFLVQYLIASVIGYITGIFFSYFLNKKWTYKIAKDSNDVFIHKYLVVYLLSLGASSITLKSLVDYFGIYPLIANIIAIGQSTVTNFVGTTFLVFNDKDRN